jgi:hypothetical protein
MERPRNSLQNEVDAMAAIGHALADLTDFAARQRVLRWAAERFAIDSAQPAAAVLTIVPAQAQVTQDPDLAVDSLSEMFDAPPEPKNTDDDLSATKAPIETVIRSFAADFQRFAEEWNGAAA